MKKNKIVRMKILVLNCGSSSVKYQIIDGGKLNLLVRGSVSEIGSEDALFWQQRDNGSEVKFKSSILDHEQAVQQILDSLLFKKTGILKDISEIFAIGHRVVHGGEYFSKPTLITDEVIEKITECSQLAPLHNPPQIKGIEACKRLIKGIPQVAVFDTAFHQTMPDYAFHYGIPYKFYEKYRIRRYGFHGTSHYYVANRVAKLMDRPLEKIKVITCHLGNGSSVAAVKNGKCIDTSMGFTPLEGLIMGTRSGDIDCSAVLYLMKHEKISAAQMDNILNKESGLKGISGNSNDMQKIVEAAKNGDERNQNALDMFCYRVKKYIGAYAAALNGVDAIVFTAGIGENAASVRASICEGLDYIGVKFNHLANKQTIGTEAVITKNNSKTKIWVIPTNEEIVIAKQTLDVVYHINGM